MQWSSCNEGSLSLTCELNDKLFMEELKDQVWTLTRYRCNILPEVSVVHSWPSVVLLPGGAEQGEAVERPGGGQVSTPEEARTVSVSHQSGEGQRATEVLPELSPRLWPQTVWGDLVFLCSSPRTSRPEAWTRSRVPSAPGPWARRWAAWRRCEGRFKCQSTRVRVLRNSAAFFLPAPTSPIHCHCCCFYIVHACCYSAVFKGYFIFILLFCKFPVCTRSQIPCMCTRTWLMKQHPWLLMHWWSSSNTGLVRSWKTWKSHGILKWSFPGLEKSWKKRIS